MSNDYYNNLLVIDGDFLAFLAASTVVERFIEVKDNVSLTSTKYKNITEFKKHCSTNSFDVSDYTIEDGQKLDDSYLQKAKYIISGKVNKFKKATGCTNVLIVMGGPTNFRNDIPLFTKYKERSASFRPVCLKEIRDLLETMYNTEYSDNCEADDLISTYQYLGHKTGNKIVVVTEDKDAKQTPGLLYNPRSELLIDCAGFGKLDLTQKNNSTYKLNGYGRLWLYYQVCCGDPVDTYQPFQKGSTITDYKFYHMFKDLNNDKVCWEKIASLYKSAYSHVQEWTSWDGKVVKGTWIDILQMYVDIAHMRRWKDDRLLVKDILDKYGIS